MWEMAGRYLFGYDCRVVILTKEDIEGILEEIRSIEPRDMAENAVVRYELEHALSVDSKGLERFNKHNVNRWISGIARENEVTERGEKYYARRDKPEPPKSNREKILEEERRQKELPPDGANWEYGYKEWKKAQSMFDKYPYLNKYRGYRRKPKREEEKEEKEENDAIEVYEAFALELEKNFNILFKGFWGEDWAKKRDVGEKKFDDWIKSRGKTRKEAREEAEMQEVIEGLQRERERLEAKNKDLRDRIDAKEDEIIALGSEFKAKRKKEKRERKKVNWDGIEAKASEVFIRVLGAGLMLAAVCSIIFITGLALSGIWGMLEDTEITEITEITEEEVTAVEAVAVAVAVVEKYNPTTYDTKIDEELKKTTTRISIDMPEYPSEHDVTVLLATVGEYRKDYKNYTFLDYMGDTEQYTVGVLVTINGHADYFDYIEEE